METGCKQYVVLPGRLYSVGDFNDERAVALCAAFRPNVCCCDAMTCGIGTSMTLETVVLHHYNEMTLREAFRTAQGMSLLSMAAMTMEASENVNSKC